MPRVARIVSRWRKMMEDITGEKPQMWGPSIVGFGTWHYKYASGHEGEWPVAAFSPRKTDLTLYLMPGFENRAELMSQLGKHKTGKSCLYIKRLSDIHIPTLKKLIKASVKDLKAYTKSQAAKLRRLERHNRAVTEDHGVPADHGRLKVGAHRVRAFDLPRLLV